MHNFVVLLGNVNGLEIICNFALVDLWHLIINGIRL